MPRSEIQVEHSDDQVLSSLSADLQRIKDNDATRVRRFPASCRTNSSFVSKVREQYEEDKRNNPRPYDGSKELEQWPTKGSAAILVDPQDGQVKAIVEYVSSALVDLDAVDGMKWRPFTAEVVAKQSNFELRVDNLFELKRLVCTKVLL